jgi:hypothetical protein
VTLEPCQQMIAPESTKDLDPPCGDLTEEHVGKIDGKRASRKTTKSVKYLGRGYAC